MILKETLKRELRISVLNKFIWRTSSAIFHAILQSHSSLKNILNVDRGRISQYYRKHADTLNETVLSLSPAIYTVHVTQFL